MLSKLNKSSVLVFITLFLLFTAVVYAVKATPDQILEQITSNSEVLRYVEKSDDIEMDSNYVFAVNPDALTMLSEDGKTLVINEKEYTFEITYKDSQGNVINLSDYDGAFAYIEPGEGADLKNPMYVQYFMELPSSAEVTYSLVPTDPSEEIISVQGRLNVKEENGVLVPDSVVVDDMSKIGWGSALWGAITGDFDRLTKFLSEVLTAITIPWGDAFLHMVTTSVGGEVTIDRVVYNEMPKFSIEFFEKPTDVDQATDNNWHEISGKPLKNVLYKLVNDFYGFFRDIVIVVYLAILVFLGIKMILSSTAKNQSSYKGMFLAWVMGVCMLMFFPYVMKYCIEMNNALCAMISEEQSKNSTGDYDGRLDPSKSIYNFRQVAHTFGTDQFIMVMLGDTLDYINDTTEKEFAQTAAKQDVFGKNAMMKVRFLAAHKLDFPLTIVYFILIGELIAILIMYYKRVFMIAFLISIFPLVMLLYPLNKIGQIRFNCFGTWFKEFLVNVFVQSFHAATYAVIVTIGVNSYLKSENWLFMIICITFLFQGEKIIRAIFSAKSKMNTIGDMAAAGIMAMNITRGMTRFIPVIGKGKKSKDEMSSADKARDDRARMENEARVSRPAGTDTMGAASNLNAMNSGSTGSGSGTSSTDIKLGRGVPPTVVDRSKAMDNSLASKQKNSNVLKTVDNVGAVFSGLSQATGTAMGLTFGLAQNDSKKGLDTAVSGAISGMNAGKTIGDGGRAIARGVVGGVINVKAGRAMARSIRAGDMDDEIDFSGVENIADAELRVKREEAIRKAYAKVAKLKGYGLDNVAEIKLIKERVDRDKYM